MKKALVLSLLFALSTSATFAAAPATSLTFDTTGADLELEALNADAAHADSAAQAAVENKDVVANMEHARGFLPFATSENFKKSLMLASAGQADPMFQMDKEKRKAADIRRLLNSVRDNPVRLSQEIVDRIVQYAPVSKPLKVRLAFVVGGGSDGFQMDEYPDTFFLDAGFFGNDEEGVVLLAAHELFHVIQNEVRPDDPLADPNKSGLTPAQKRIAGLRQLFVSLEREGTASVVGDPISWPVQGGAYMDFFRAKFNRNLSRRASNFQQFDTLVFRAAHDPDADTDALYRLGFAGDWDSNAYFVGYIMAKAIDRYMGRDAFRALLTRPAEEMVLEYADLQTKHPEDKDLPPIARTTVAAAKETLVFADKK